MLSRHGAFNGVVSDHVFASLLHMVTLSSDHVRPPIAYMVTICPAGVISRPILGVNYIVFCPASTQVFHHGKMNAPINQ